MVWIFGEVLHFCDPLVLEKGLLLKDSRTGTLKSLS